MKATSQRERGTRRRETPAAARCIVWPGQGPHPAAARSLTYGRLRGFLSGIPAGKK